jgi:hypothetical protein
LRNVLRISSASHAHFWSGLSKTEFFPFIWPVPIAPSTWLTLWTTSGGGMRPGHDSINRMAKAEMEAGTYDTVMLPEGAEDELSVLKKAASGFVETAGQDLKIDLGEFTERG